MVPRLDFPRLRYGIKTFAFLKNWMVYVKARVAEAAAEEPRRLLRSETVTLERAGWEEKKKSKIKKWQKKESKKGKGGHTANKFLSGV